MDSRRDFLAGAALTAGSLARAAAGEKLRFGLIGCGGYGLTDLRAAFANGGVECAALCDVDSAHLAAASAEVEKLQGSRPRTFQKYQELLEQPGLRFVVIATPPHWHALPFLDACRRKLDIYCEKPLAYDVREGRAMVDAAKAAGNVVQIGFQRRQGAAVRQAREYIRGQAGRIVQVDANIHFSAGTPDPTPQAPPASLDWELWLGPAPKMPYSPAVGHRSWRLEANIGNGHLVDWGIHLVDAVRYMTGESTPSRVVAAGGTYHHKGKFTTPDTLTVHFEFDRFPLVWRQRIWGAAEWSPEVNNGVFLYGEKETVFVSDTRWAVVPRGRADQPRRSTEIRSEAGPLHMADFLNAVRTRGRAACPPEDGYQSTTTVQLAMIALRSGGAVEWDRAAESIPGNPRAAALLKREYRAPYLHPWKG